MSHHFDEDEGVGDCSRLGEQSLLYVMILGLTASGWSVCYSGSRVTSSGHRVREEKGVRK